MKENEVVYSNNLNIFIRLAPILILMTFYLATIIVFEFGPHNWPVTNKLELYSYLFVAYLFMFIGFLISVRNKKVRVRTENLQIFKLFLLLFVVVLPITAYGRTGSFIPNIFNAQLDFGAAYYESQQYRIAWPEYIRILLSPALFAAIPLGIYFWGKLKFNVKVIYIIGIFYYLSIDISRGTNKSIAEFILIVIILGFLNVFIKNKNTFSNNTSLKKLVINKKSLRNSIITILVSIALLIIFFNLFTLFISSRTTSLYNPFSATYTDLDNILLSFLATDNQKFGMAALMSYLSQGYYGLSLALDKPFYFTGGIGYSTFLLNNFSDLGFEQIKYNTYALRLAEDNWPTGQVWSSFFVWPASDITFYGVLILMFTIGYILGSTWISSLIGNDYASVVLFSLFCILAFYIPMNNQLFQSGELFICTWFWIGYWFKEKFRIRLR
jgi:hypothetical protein